jgi:hypothetical protein
MASLFPEYELCYYFMWPEVKQTLKGKVYGDLEQLNTALVAVQKTLTVSYCSTHNC